MSNMHAPIVLAVMGPTGVGKSTFIKNAGATACDPDRRGQEPVVGHGQEACTSMPELYQLPESETYLLDTPGFDDTYLSDREILLRISRSLKEFSDTCRVTGILYLHQIIDARMKGSARKNLIMFSKLVGSKNMRNCCMITTKWSDIDKATGDSREAELKTNENFWQPMLAKGAKIARFDNTGPSARSIIESVVAGQPFVPQVIVEWAQNKELSRTNAGMEVEDRVGQMRDAHETQMQECKEETQRALDEKDYETARALESERQRIQEQLDIIEKERDLLKEQHTEALAREEGYVQEREAHVARQMRRSARSGRWGKRLMTIGLGGMATVLTGGLAAPVAVLAYSAVEADCQEDRKKWR